MVVLAVSTNTKIQIWKQITTIWQEWSARSKLYQPIQKYKFESKSQPGSVGESIKYSCINQYKNTNLKANHNWQFANWLQFLAVSTNTKIQIWKQITTNFLQFTSQFTLYQPIQKYKFESKSQLTTVNNIFIFSCINQYKNTNLKANHNYKVFWIKYEDAVSTNTKIQIWKQITTHRIFLPLSVRCINQYKNTNLKANHNLQGNEGRRRVAVSTNTKIQIWKQITTPTFVYRRYFGLYQPIQKYKFESKSQHGLTFDNIKQGCINQYKNTNLKANHNNISTNSLLPFAVSTNTKIQIWKQITTSVFAFPYRGRLYQPIQKYKFESKSQQ